MKKSIKTLIAITALASSALTAAAQPALKILVVDMAKLYDTHYKTLDYNAKLQADDQAAQLEVSKLNTEGDALVKQYTALADQVNNPALSADAKTKAQNDAQKKLEEIQGKQREVQSFIQQTQASLQQRLRNFRGIMLDEISKSATEIAKRRGATVLLDKSGPSGIGISNIIYSDAAYDITEEVSKELNKDRPATPPAPAAPAPTATAPAASPAAPAAAPAPAPSGATPSINMPALPKK